MREGGRRRKGEAYLLLVDTEDRLVGVSGDSTRRPLGMLFPYAFLGYGRQTHGLSGPELHDADAALGGVTAGRGGRGGRKGGMEEGGNVSG